MYNKYSKFAFPNSKYKENFEQKPIYMELKIMNKNYQLVKRKQIMNHKINKYK